MSIFTRSNFVRRSLTLAAICGASVAAMSAQNSQPSAQSSQPVAQTVTAPLVNFKMLALDSSLDAVSSSSSSTTDDEASVVTADPLHLNAMQYNGRRRYGRPRYRGGNTNPDGSNKWIFYGAAGLSQPAGNTWKYFTPSWGIQIGGGRQFSAHFAVPVEFDFDHFGLSKQTMANQSYIYTGDFNAADNGIDANMHTWSFSIDPTYTLFNGVTADGLGAYIVADVGFYHKVSSFTSPQEEEYCSPYYGCGIYELNSNFDHYTSNAPGFGGGIGLTYKFSHFTSERLYAEARYVFVDNSQRTGYTVTEAENGVAYGGNNFFPANSNRTTFIPVKFGVRF
jgi:hypothetical protein